MKAISVKQPWAYLLCAGIKGIENRTWKLPDKYKGKRVLIHASAKTDKEPYMLFDDAQIDAVGNDIMDVVASYHNTSAIIGSVVFTDSVINHQSVWAEKTHMAKLGEHELPSCLYHPYKPIYNWVASDPILFDKPIAAKGKLGFWEYKETISMGYHGLKEGMIVDFLLGDEWKIGYGTILYFDDNSGLPVVEMNYPGHDGCRWAHEYSLDSIRPSAL